MTTYCSLNYKFNTWKFQAQKMGRTCCVQKLKLTFRTIYVHNMLSPCSAKIRASDKDLPVRYIYQKAILSIFETIAGSFLPLRLDKRGMSFKNFFGSIDRILDSISHCGHSHFCSFGKVKTTPYLWRKDTWIRSVR